MTLTPDTAMRFVISDRETGESLSGRLVRSEARAFLVERGETLERAERIVSGEMNPAYRVLGWLETKSLKSEDTHPVAAAKSKTPAPEHWRATEYYEA